MTTRSPEQYDWDKALFNDRRLSKNFTSPRRGKITHVTLHHMTIVAPADKPRSTVAVEGAYKTWMGGRAASANYGVSGDLVWQYVSDMDAAWSDANSTSNNSTLSIEHANSTAGPKWQISDATMRTGQRLVATLHRLYGLGRPSRKTVRVHRDYYATACPGPYMMARLDEYIAAAAHFYDNPEDDMALTDDDIAKIAKAVWQYGIASTFEDENKGKKYRAEQHLAYNNAQAHILDQFKDGAPEQVEPPKA